MENELGKRIRYARKKKKLSQQELGKKIEVSGASVGQYEIGQNKPGLENLIKLSNILEVSLDWLTKGDGESDYQLETISNKPADQGQFGSEVERLLREENEELKKDKSYLRNQVEFLTKLIEDKGLGKDEVMKGIAGLSNEVTTFMTPQPQLQN